MLLRMLPVSYYGQNYAGIVHQRLLLYEHTTKTALIEMYYASFCQTTAVTGQDCEQYTLCRDCITLPQCTWCSDNTVSPAGLGKDRCCCGFLMYIDKEYNPLIGPNLAEYFYGIQLAGFLANSKDFQSSLLQGAT